MEVLFKKPGKPFRMDVFDPGNPDYPEKALPYGPTFQKSRETLPYGSISWRHDCGGEALDLGVLAQIRREHNPPTPWLSTRSRGCDGA